MKRRHRIPPQAHFVSDPITPQYQAEVDATMARAEHREQRAQRRLAIAEAQLATLVTATRKASQEHRILVARELVEIRRQELLGIQRAMGTAPSSAVHRGTGHGKKPVPGMQVI